MSIMRRIVLLLVLAACLPLITAGGGINPPPENAIAVGPTLDAIIVMDPHDPDAVPTTTTAKRATIWLSRKNFGTAGAVFSIPPSGFPLFLGCDLALTETRFVNNGGTPVTLDSWIPGDVVTKLFEQVGVTVSPIYVPTVSAIRDQRCTRDPNPANNGEVTKPGFLVLRAEIGFLATSAVKVWIGLRNSDDVGASFDVRATVLQNGAAVGSGQLEGEAGGSSGFNNARLYAIPVSMASALPFASGDTLSVEISVRTACTATSHFSGTARLWFDGAATDSGPKREPGSRFQLTVAGVPSDFFLGEGSVLSGTPGAKRLFVDKAAGPRCGEFKSFGTWTATIP